MSTLREWREALASLVATATGFTEWARDATGPLPVTASYFIVKPTAVSGRGKRRLDDSDTAAAFDVELRCALSPEPAVRMGEALDHYQRVVQALLVDVDASVVARASLGDAVYDYDTPGYVGIVFPVTLDGTLTTAT